jgi:hypothetical protein
MSKPDEKFNKVKIHPFYAQKGSAGRNKILIFLREIEKTSEVVILDDGTISVKGDVILRPQLWHKIPVKFIEVTGDFIIARNHLGLGTSMESKLEALDGSPEKVGGTFDISNNQILTLEYGPKQVGALKANNCKLQNLIGMPVVTSGNIMLDKNRELKSLRGSPNEAEIFSVKNCSLKTLEGAPQVITSSFDCSDNENLKSLMGGPVESGTFICSNTSIENLEGAPKKTLSIDFSNNKKMISLKGLPIGDNIQYKYDGIPSISKKTFDDHMHEVKAAEKYNKKDLDDYFGIDINDF